MKTLSLALFSSFSLALFACGEEDDATSDVDMPINELAPVTWRNCGVVLDRDVRCAEIAVPLDHDDPSGPSIELSINRIPANPDAEYKGVLFVNPGGPGESGQDMALGLVASGTADAIAFGYDIVGFDPRGVAESGERGCGPTPVRDMPYGGLQDVVSEIRANGVRCENAGWPNVVQTDATDLLACMRECLQRDDCTGVTDYLWLEQPDLGCYLYLSTCNDPSFVADWGDEDGGHDFRRVCED